jgi:hypothetical protein
MNVEFVTAEEKRQRIEAIQQAKLVYGTAYLCVD